MKASFVFSLLFIVDLSSIIVLATSQNRVANKPSGQFLDSIGFPHWILKRLVILVIFS